MTREEIIDGLEIYTVGRLKKDRVHITVGELQEFINEIKALEQEPCEDAVSRKAVINEIFYSTDNSGDVVLGSLLRERIERLPSVTLQESKWIPCSERLPKRNGYYLVTGRQGAVNKRLYQDGHWYGNWAILAWMPLPEPYVTEINVGKKAESEVK